MKFGACCSADIERVKILKQFGYDYAEGGCGAITSLSDDDFEKYYTEFVKIGLPMPVANGFFPSEIKLAGQQSDKDLIKDYLKRFFRRADFLGIEKVIFGSGGARNIPDSMSINDGIGEIVWDLKNIICPMATEHNITVVIEPLRKEECNIFNTVRESVDIIEEAGIENLKVLADVYHMVCMNEPIDSIKNLSGILVHAHTSNPVGGNTRRVYPKQNDGFNQKGFINNLIYTGVETCSVEAGTDNFYEDAKNALPVLKAALE
ncbi:MAG: sugar phosphate isomerase/epimerase [Clostridia bacterium]|nr:sugar phosphate isomerase/epimerase [Clostridia bacterium]